MWASSLFVAFCTAGRVSAHGFLCTITINGQIYNGNNPVLNSKNASVIRTINDPNPNVGSSNPALTCGPGALAASQVADANPGDMMTFKWINSNYSNVSALWKFRNSFVINISSGRTIRVRC